ncbi:MAG: NAD(P)-dependent oxidoreductase [Rhodoblastus sp.]
MTAETAARMALRSGRQGDAVLHEPMSSACILVLGERSRQYCRRANSIDAGARRSAGIRRAACWVDEAALIVALHARKIACAALDVYDVEPLPKDHLARSRQCRPRRIRLRHAGRLFDLVRRHG